MTQPPPTPHQHYKQLRTTQVGARTIFTPWHATKLVAARKGSEHHGSENDNSDGAHLERADLRGCDFAAR